MSLADLQRRFHTRVVAGVGACEDVDPRAQRGLRVYSHAYRATLVACLRGTFEKTHAWLGDEAFDAAAAAHAGAAASRSWTLSAYGDDFPRRLADLHPHDPEVEELAWLDWSLRRAFDGPDAPPLDPAALADVEWETAVLRLHPTLAARALATNAPAIWTAMAQGETPPPAATLLRPLALRVWRQDFVPTFRTIDPEERFTLELACAGVALGAICRALAERTGDEAVAASMAGNLLGAWISDGLLTAVAGPESPTPPPGARCLGWA